MWASYPASLRNAGGSTQVPVMHGGLPSPVMLECGHITFTMFNGVMRSQKYTMNYSKGKSIIQIQEGKGYLAHWYI